MLKRMGALWLAVLLLLCMGLPTFALGSPSAGAQTLTSPGTDTDLVTIDLPPTDTDLQPTTDTDLPIIEEPATGTDLPTPPEPEPEETAEPTEPKEPSEPPVIEDGPSDEEEKPTPHIEHLREVVIRWKLKDREIGITDPTLPVIYVKHVTHAMSAGDEDGLYFTDVPKKAWFYGSVMVCAESGLFGGYPDHTFRPKQILTRSEAVQALYVVYLHEKQLDFPDDADVLYEDAVLWALENGIVCGYHGEYAPAEPLTREMLCSMLFRLDELLGNARSYANDLSAFPDGAEVSEWARDSVRWASGRGILQGLCDRGNVRLGAGVSVTRAQYSGMLARYLQLCYVSVK